MVLNCALVTYIMITADIGLLDAVYLIPRTRTQELVIKHIITDYYRPNAYRLDVIDVK